MSKIIIDEKYVSEYIEDILNSCKIGHEKIVENAKFHHNTDYENAGDILKYGILSLRELNRLGLRQDSKEFLKLMDDIESHINGIDGVSLSVVGLNNNDPRKFLFTPIDNTKVDFLVTSDIIAGRCGSNYDNEYICRQPITPNMLRAIDIRLLSYAKEIMRHASNKSINNKNISGLVERYNYLKYIAGILKETNLDIPFREMSDDNLVLDVDKVVKIPTLVLNKKVNELMG